MTDEIDLKEEIRLKVPEQGPLDKSLSGSLPESSSGLLLDSSSDSLSGSSFDPTSGADTRVDGDEISRRLGGGSELPSVLLDRYEQLGQIGAGGMGVVHKARHRLMDQIVAVKILKMLESNETALLRFRQEAKAASKIQHDNVVSIHDFGVANDTAYLVMEFVDGCTLSDVIKERGTLPVDEALSIFNQICRGLISAHDAGVIHRDLKPSNVLLAQLTKQDRVVAKIADFGIAKLEMDEQGLTQTGEIFGSPLYMSPEQCRGQVADLRSDIYSLGCVMYETLCGVPPISGNNALDTIHKRLNDSPRPLSEFRSDVPPGLECLILDCLMIDPSRRPQDVFAVLNVLEDGGRLKKSAKKYRKGTGNSTATFRPFVALWFCILVTVVIFSICLGFWWFDKATRTAPFIPTISSAATNNTESNLVSGKQEMKLGDEARHKNDMKGAEEHYRKAAELLKYWPNWQASALTSLATVLQSGHRYEEARPLLEKATLGWTAEYGPISPYAAYGHTYEAGNYIKLNKLHYAEYQLQQSFEILKQIKRNPMYKTERTRFLAEFKNLMLAKEWPEERYLRVQEKLPP